MSSLALYRTYRPGRFADVVGQDHVTGPLTRALANNRVHHAYLFSGPRGCGKTSSARILARSLNCEKGPTAEPCEQCKSCTDLAPNGPGSIDVVELDAATHGLVDDARELREKAHFAPVSSRFKIYIIDEAHQLGPGAANALLKLIEEPPSHLKFIFATTAPDKILGTIRSRTYHYPFRLIPAKTLQQNLAAICESEGVAIEPAALALVARAGAGSARDSQSVLGQLIAGAGDEGVTYDLAVTLLGFTDAALLDEVVDAIAVGDAATVFGGIDKVMESGHDPRRFLTDLLERFRDLIIIREVADAVSTGLIEAPEEEAARMAAQAAQFGQAELVRLADVVDEGITAMKGATPTRLQLELVCARMLLPGADGSLEAMQARLERLERRHVVVPGAQPAGPAAETQREAPAAGPPAVPPPAERPAAPAAAERPAAPAPAERPAAPAPAASEERPTTPTVTDSAAEPTPPDVSGQNAEPARDAAAPPAAPPTAAQEPVAAPPEPAGAGSAIADVRRMWPEVLVRLREIKRTPWSLISQESTVTAVSDGVLTLSFRQASLRDTFARREDFQAHLRQAISDVLGVDLRIEAIVDPSGAGSSGVGSSGAGSSGAGQGAGGSPSGGQQDSRGGSASPGAGAGWGTQPGSGTLSGQGDRTAAPDPREPGRTDQGQAGAQNAAGTGAPSPAQSARAAVRATVSARSAPDASGQSADDNDHGADPDDTDMDDSGVSERELLERTLGARVIEEIEHS